MTDLIVIGIVLIIVAVAIAYIVKEKKKGTKCIGCPYAGQCAAKNSAHSCNGGCQSDT